MASGGDGDGWIVSPMYKKLADLFEQYAKQRDWFTGRWDGDGFVGFGGQESVTFVDDSKFSQAREGDVTVYIPWDLIGIEKMDWNN